jgi:hypothetical protein
MVVMADDELDSLYWVQPDGFTAQRTKLIVAAKQRGEAPAAKRLSAARKPTTAAWVVNRLALRHKDAKQRLADLGDRLRAAHAAMDGDRIRDLSAEQHKLIDELARAAFEAADVRNPTSTVRDDLTSTLQAAIADPDVRARLGRLAKPERWSGFGAFGDVAPVVTATRAGKAKAERKQSRPKPAKKPPPDTAADQRLEKLNAAVTAAERAKAEADGMLSERQAEHAAARQRRDQARASLREAQRDFDSAEDHYDKAKQASRAAAGLVKEAKAQLKRGMRR